MPYEILGRCRWTWADKCDIFPHHRHSGSPRWRLRREGRCGRAGEQAAQLSSAGHTQATLACNGLRNQLAARHCAPPVAAAAWNYVWWRLRRGERGGGSRWPTYALPRCRRRRGGNIIGVRPSGISLLAESEREQICLHGPLTLSIHCRFFPPFAGKRPSRRWRIGDLDERPRLVDIQLASRKRPLHCHPIFVLRH